MTFKSWNFFLVWLTNWCVYLMTVKQKRNKNAEHLTYLYAFLSISSQAGIEVTGESLFASSHDSLYVAMYTMKGAIVVTSPRCQSEASLKLVVVDLFGFFVIGTYGYNSPKLFNPKNSLKSIEDFQLTVLIKR